MKTFKDYLQEESSVDEALSIQGRIKKKQALRRNKAKIKLGRIRASRRIASRSVLKKRAMRAARTFMFKRLVKNKSKGDLAYSARGTYEKMINKRKAAVAKIAQRLIPKLKRAELERKLNKNRKGKK